MTHSSGFLEGCLLTEGHDVVVIGAGMAGVTAARNAVRAGLDVVVVESTDRVGGRILTARDFARDPVEHGAEFVHTDHADTWSENSSGLRRPSIDMR
ncbi:MAG TPA: FAD-dependent oxidoreductase, partial [Acidimicrobiia bacterium]|nr:FAD-dependent oxidoreductase [Acidimicrobiia bacterium]